MVAFPRKAAAKLPACVLDGSQQSLLETAPTAVLDRILANLGAATLQRVLAVARRFREAAASRAARHPSATRADKMLGVLMSRCDASMVTRLAMLSAMEVATDGRGGVLIACIPSLLFTLPRRSALEPPARRRALRVELRCPAKSWHPWLPLVLRFSASDDAEMRQRRRNIAPIPPVCEVTSADPESRETLADIAEYLHARGEVGTLTAGFSDSPRCNIYCISRARAVASVPPFPFVRERLPAQDATVDGRRVLWGVVVPSVEASDEMETWFARYFEQQWSEGKTAAFEKAFDHVLAISSAASRRRRCCPLLRPPEL